MTTAVQEVVLVAVLLRVVGVGLGLNADGVALVSFKRAALGDPLSVLMGWNENDESPCGWNGVVCAPVSGEYESRVVGLVLPGAQLLASIPDQLGSVRHLRHIDLSHNLLNGTIPPSLFNATELKILTLADNVLSGGIPGNLGVLPKLQYVNLSSNALGGPIPPSLTYAPALRFLSLSSNYFSGEIPPGFAKSQPLEALDLSSNLLNGSIPSEIDGVRYLNLSSNRLTGQISPEIGQRVPDNATIDLSYNNLSGPVPGIGALLNQKQQYFAGNPNLCGIPLKTVCNVLSMPYVPPNVTTTTTSPPAIAAIPGSLPQLPSDSTTQHPSNQSKPVEPRTSRSGIVLAPGTIAGIVVGNFVAISLVLMIFLYRYQVRKKKAGSPTFPASDVAKKKEESGRRCCLLAAGKREEEEGDSVSDDSSSSTFESDGDERKPGRLVIVDGEPGEQIELERLLKASAYILGANGSTIVYKAVLEDGTTLAVRRIGESAVYRMKDFENRVRTIAKLRHPNLIRIRGFYWGSDEKLLIYDYAINGNLATFSHATELVAVSPVHLKWEIRLRVGQGVARGLAYLHEKKYVHGNLKPSNVLLGRDMEPQIGDLGLERLVLGKGRSSSAVIGGSMRSALSRDSLSHETSLVPLSSGSPLGASTNHVSPYQAPEALRTLKPTPKGDVYSFGVLLLELVTGRPVSESELVQGPPGERNPALRMVDPRLRTDVEENEEMLLVCLRLGFACVSGNPQKRPAMKEVVQVLDRIPTASSLLRPSFSVN